MIENTRMYQGANNFDSIDGPEPLCAVLAASYEAYTSDGHTPDKAKQLAMRHVQHAGWYRTKDGWKRLGPDLRGKVNVRCVEEQPDGRFLIPDVEVFYPNAVKGKDRKTRFAVEEIARAVENTNRAVESGGQKPGLVIGHPVPEAKLLGVQSPQYGAAINFRRSDKGDGWVQCDLVDVRPEVVEKWKKGEYTGLSAGFVNDAGDLNLRFGHIALLGADIQALSHLPATEIFSVEGQLCFSTDPATFITKGNTMNGKKTDGFAALKGAFDALASAYASAEAGEPGHEQKLTEATKVYQGAVKEFGSPFEGDSEPAPPADGGGDGHPDEAEDIALIEQILGEDGGPAEAPGQVPPTEGEGMCSYKGESRDIYDAGFRKGYEAATGRTYEANPSEETVLPDDNVLADTDEITGDEDAEIPDASKASEYAAEFAALKRKNGQLTKIIAGLYGKSIRGEFQSYLVDLQQKGHQFDSAKAMDALINVAAKPQALAAVKAMLESSPNSPLTNAGTTFGAEGANNPNSDRGNNAIPSGASDDEVLSILRDKMPGLTFKAEDVQLARLCTAP